MKAISLFIALTLTYFTLTTKSMSQIGIQGSVNAETVLNKTVDVYRSFSSYRDVSEVEVATNFGKNQSVNAKSASLLFKRPNHWRFEWKETNSDRAELGGQLVADSEKTILYFKTLNQYADNLALATGLAAITGASSILAFTIPSLLHEDIPVDTMMQLYDIRLLPSERIANKLCHLIYGKFTTGVEYKFWVGVDDFLVYQVEQKIMLNDIDMREIEESVKASGIQVDFELLKKSPNASVVTRETHSKIETNKYIADDVFKFKLPAGATLNQDLFNMKK